MAKNTLRTASNDVISNLRKSCIAALRKGKTQQEAATLFGVGLSTLKSWVKQYKETGSKSFTLKTRGVKKGSRDLSLEQLGYVKKLMTNKLPDQLKLPFTLWTREAVQSLIYKKFQVKKSLPQIGRYLQSWGFSAQKPIYKAYEQDPEAVKEWLEKTYPKIKGKAKKEKAEIYFGDEAGMRSDHHAGKSYSKKGKTPIVKKTGQRFGINMISAVSARGGKRFMLYKGKFNSERYILFLKQLIKNSKHKIYLIMDNYSVHKTNKVGQWIERHKDKIAVYYLPTYSPELNPDELLNQDVKTNVVGKLRASNAHELKENVKSHLKKIPKEKIISFFKHQETKYAA
jgi:transposase